MIPYLWLAAAVLMAVVEALTVNLVSIWFAVGAIAGMLACMAGATMFWQFAVFVAVSAVAFVLTRPLVKKLHAKKMEPTNADSFVGRVVVVTHEIRPGFIGRAKLDDVEWNAVCSRFVAQGSNARITAVSGATLTVEPEELS